MTRLLLLLSVFSSLASAKFEGDKVRECGEKEFPSTVKIDISFQTEDGIEVWNSLCSGTCVDAKLVMTAKHCLEETPNGYFSSLPKAILSDCNQRKKKIKAVYSVNGKPAIHALSGRSRQSLLIFADDLNVPAAKIAKNAKFEKGRHCQGAGFSPVPYAEPGLSYDETLQSDLKDLEKTRRNRAKLFAATKKRCAQIQASGRRLKGPNLDGGEPKEKESDLVLFYGRLDNSASAQPGDSGAACYVEEDGEWRLAGVFEGGTRDYVDAKGEQKTDNATENRSNLLTLIEGGDKEKIESLLDAARLIRDKGVPKGHANFFVPDDRVHLHYRKSESK